MVRSEVVSLTVTICACIVMLSQPLAIAGTTTENSAVDTESAAAGTASLEVLGNDTSRNATAYSPCQVSQVPTEAPPLEFVPDPAPLTMNPGVVGNVTRCFDSNTSLSSFKDVSSTGNSIVDGGMGALDSGTVDIYGRVLYENVITAESAAGVLPESQHPYLANSNPATWYIYGEPDTSSIMIFFSSIQTQYPNDYILIKDSQGNLAWPTLSGTYTNQWVTVWSHSARIELYSDGSDQRWGFQVTRFVQDSRQWFPVQGVTVNIYDKDTWSGDDLLASVVTNSEGRFSALGIPNVDPWPEGSTLDIYCTMDSTSDHARVIMDGGGAYTMTTPVWSNVPDGYNDLGDLAPSEATNTAWMVYQDLLDCWNTFAYGGPGYQAPRIKAVWTSGHNAHYHTGCPDGSHIDFGGLWAGEVHLSSEDGQVVDTVLHEAGHVIMFREYGNWVPGEISTHFYTMNYAEKYAWTEGWADFVPAAVGLYTGKGDAYYDTANLGLCGYQFSMETAQQLGSGECPGNGAWSGGDTNEATVSYALYDIYDSNDDGTDSFDGGLNGIWTVFDDRRINDFSDFYDAFREHYSSSPPYHTSCHNAIKQGSRGTINYDPVMFYDDFTDGSIPDWIIQQSGGPVSLDYSSYLAPVPVPALKIVKSSSASPSSAMHKFATQGGFLTIEASIRVSNTVGPAYILVSGASTESYEVCFAVWNGLFQWYCSGWHSTGVSVQASTWYHIGFSLDIANKMFDIYLDGDRIQQNAAFFNMGNVHYPDRVSFQAGDGNSGYYITEWVDYVVVRRGKTVFRDEFKDTSSWSLDTTGGTITLDNLQGSFATPNLKLVRGTGGTGGVSATSTPAFGPLTQKVYVDIRFQMSAINYQWRGAYISLKDASGNVLVHIAFVDGHIKWLDTTGWHDSGATYVYGTWYVLGFEVEIPSKTFNLYKDGTLMSTTMNFYYQGSSIAAIKIQSGDYGPDGCPVTLWVDDLIIRGA